MTEWFCFKDKEKMVEKNIDVSYLGITRPILGIACPKCKVAYIEKDIATTTLKTGEAIMEKKRG